MKLRKSLSMSIIKVGRKLFYNTPIQKWPLTSLVYDTIFHAGYSEKELSTTYMGAKLTFPGRDFTITPGLVGGFYEKYELELFQSICARSKRVVDVGGNIGLYSVVAGNEGCTVEVFEPVPENQRYLTKNIAKNKLQNNVQLVKKAVGAKKGKADIFLSKKNIGTHSLAPHDSSFGKSLKVDVVVLDEYLSQKPKVDVLKIDVEGYDGYVLEGAKKLIARDHPTLFIELVPAHLQGAQYSPIDFVRLVADHYKSIYLVDEVNNSVSKATKSVLLDFIKANKNANLVAVSKKAHEDVIASFSEV